MASTDRYTDRITSEHKDKPKFFAWVSALVQGLVDNIAVSESISAAYDIDNAVGNQLDVVGQWVGRTRYLSTPINAYFSLDVAGLGLNEGVLKTAFDPSTGLVRLPDPQYRMLLKARIAANHWDGTIPGAYDVWNTVFAGTGWQILLQDYGDMSMTIALLGPKLDAITQALLTGGYFALKPAGVQVRNYYVQSVPSTPFFGLNAENSAIAGLNVGALGTVLPPT